LITRIVTNTIQELERPIKSYHVNYIELQVTAFCLFFIETQRILKSFLFTKNIKHQQMYKRFFIPLTHSYMFRPCWVIFRENFLPWLHYACTL
jgi:hypothetical protein